MKNDQHGWVPPHFCLGFQVCVVTKGTTHEELRKTAGSLPLWLVNPRKNEENGGLLMGCLGCLGHRTASLLLARIQGWKAQAPLQVPRGSSVCPGCQRVEGWWVWPGFLW